MPDISATDVTSGNNNASLGNEAFIPTAENNVLRPSNARSTRIRLRIENTYTVSRLPSPLASRIAENMKHTRMNHMVSWVQKPRNTDGFTSGMKHSTMAIINNE